MGYPAAVVRVKTSARLEKAQLVAISETGAGGGGGIRGVAFLSLPPILSHRPLPPYLRSCVCVRVEPLREWTSQFTLLTLTGGSPRYQRRKAPGGLSLVFLKALNSGICQSGTKRRETWTVVKNERARAERQNAAAPGSAARWEDNALSVKVMD